MGQYRFLHWLRESGQAWLTVTGSAWALFVGGGRPDQAAPLAGVARGKQRAEWHVRDIAVVGIAVSVGELGRLGEQVDALGRAFLLDGGLGIFQQCQLLE